MADDRVAALEARVAEIERTVGIRVDAPPAAVEQPAEEAPAEPAGEAGADSIEGEAG